MEELTLESVGGRRLAAVRHQGEGASPRRILALHGWLDNAGTFKYLAPRLAPHEVVALDFVGHGHSDPYPVQGWHHYADHLSDIHAALDGLGWDHCVLLGHSMGGGLALLYAAAFPERVERLISLDALGPFSPQTDPVATLRKALAARSAPVPEGRTFASLEDALNARRQRFALDDAAIKALAERGLTRHKGGYRWTADRRHTLPSLRYFTEAEIDAALAALSCPVRVVQAATPMHPMLPDMIAARGKKIADYGSATVPGHHHFHLDDPDAAAAQVGAFLDA